MAKNVEATLGGQVMEADLGVRLRDTARMTGKKDPDFRATVYKRPTRVHEADGHMPAHFEHLKRNKHCPLSHKV